MPPSATTGTENNEYDLVDDVRAAMEQVSSAEESTPPDEALESKRERDETGKFKAKAEEVRAAEKLEPGAEPTTPTAAKEGEAPAPLLTQDKPPRGWSPAASEKWNTIPEDLRQEILRREEASAVGVRQLQERYAPMEGFVNSIGDFLGEAQRNNVDPSVYVSGVLATERALRSGDTPAKFQTLLKIADDYGIPLRDIINESVGQKVLGPAAPQPAVAQLPPEIMRELQEMREWRESQQTGTAEATIREFSKGKDYFEQVKDTMATLIESGAAADLQEAYDSACWANPTIRAALLQKQQLEEQQKTATGAGVRPAGALPVADDFSDDDDLADTVRKAMSKGMTGRV